MFENHSGPSLFADVKAGAETGAALGRRVTGIAGAVIGGLAGAVAGCIYWLAAKPLQSGKE